QEASTKNSQYATNLNRGKCVLRSLNHYCGSAVLRSKDNKCNFNGCTNYIRDVLTSGNASDSQFVNALENHRSCIIRNGGSRYSHVAERFRKEICYIDSSMSIC
ncbi:Uncharacterized protein FKW44_024301, partial [Caligus rogercresseyi]